MEAFFFFSVSVFVSKVLSKQYGHRKKENSTGISNDHKCPNLHIYLDAEIEELH
jgi:hypothetical protein